MSNQSSSHLDGVQLLRGVAALLVVVGHALSEAEQMLLNGYPRWNFPWGIGVDIFFVISGFIMVYTSRNLFSRRDSVIEFIKRRAIRIIPLYYIFTALMVLAIFIKPDQLNSASFSLERLLASLAFIPVEDSRGTFRPILGLGWTLNYEMFFYAIFSGLIWLPRKHAVTALLAALGLIVLTVNYWPVSVPALTFWSDSIILEFGIGAILGWAYSMQDSERPWLGASVAIVMVAYYFLVWKHDTPDRVSTFGVLAALTLYLAVWHWPYSEERRLNIFRVIGDSSYSLYLSHPFSLAVVKMVYAKSFLAGSGTSYVIVATLVATVVSVIIYKFVEQPLVRVGKKVIGHR